MNQLTQLLHPPSLNQLEKSLKRFFSKLKMWSSTGRISSIVYFYVIVFVSYVKLTSSTHFYRQQIFYEMENNSRGLNRLRTLYPFVCEDEGFPLPLCWSSEVKFYFVSLSENKLRVTYKGRPINNFYYLAILAHQSSLTLICIFSRRNCNKSSSFHPRLWQNPIGCSKC